MEGQRTQYNIECRIRKIQTFHGRALIFNALGRVYPLGNFKHFMGNIRPQHVCRAVFKGIFTVSAIAAAQIQNTFLRKIR